MSDVDLTRYARILRRWLRLIILAVAIAAGASYAVSMSMPKMYLSSVTLLVGEETTSARVSFDDISVSQRAAAVYAGMARRQPVLQSTVDALRLPFSWRELQSRVVVVRPEGSQFLEIRVTDTDAQRAQANASEVARQLILQSATAENLQQLEQRRQFIRQQLDKLQADIQAAETALTEKQMALQQEVGARGVLDLQDEIKALEAKLATWRTAYALLLTSNDVKRPNTLSVIEPAFTPSDPISPNVRANVLLAAALGLLLTLGAVLFIEYLVNSDGLETAEDVRRAFGTAALGTVPHLGRRTNGRGALTRAKEPYSQVAEACRVLRTSIQFAYGEDSPLMLLVTSPGLGEGKSVTSASLGVSFAQAGKRTVLVDADPRNASLHTFFGLPNDRGLTSLLASDPAAIEEQAIGGAATAPHPARRTLDASLLSTDVPGLSLLPAGPMSAVHPGELLASTEMRRLVETVRGAADVVIVDSPPILLVADTAILASMGWAVVLVAEAGRTRGQAISQAKELLLRAQARVLGVVLNKVRGSALSYDSYNRSESDGAAARPGNTGGSGPVTAVHNPRLRVVTRSARVALPDAAREAGLRLLRRWGR